jgi:hypothetical protein
MKISLLCPSRERLNKFITFTSSVFATTNNINNIEIILGVDDDDPKFYEYKRIANNLNFIKFIILPEGLFKEEGLSGLWNYMVEKTDGDILAMVGDDMIFKTNDWDKKIIDTFKAQKDPLWLVHCNDGMRGSGNKYQSVAPMAVNSFIHREYVNIVGRYVQTEVKEIFQDTYLDRLFSILDRKIYYHDILIKHLHYSEGGTKDNTTDVLEETRKGIWDNENLFKEKLGPVMSREVKLIRDKINF